MSVPFVSRPQVPTERTNFIHGIEIILVLFVTSAITLHIFAEKKFSLSAVPGRTIEDVRIEEDERIIEAPMKKDYEYLCQCLSILNFFLVSIPWHNRGFRCPLDIRASHCVSYSTFVASSYPTRS